MTDATATSPGLAIPFRRKQGTRRRIAAVLSLALIVAAAFASLYLLQATEAQLRDVARAEALRRETRDFIIALTDAEASQRGFLLTRDAQFLESYDDAIQRVGTSYDSLLELVVRLPAQRYRITSIADAVARKRAELDSTVSLARSGRMDEAVALVGTGAGATLTGEIRTAVNAMIASEDDVLLRRNSALETTRLWLVASILTALAGSAVLVGLLFYRTRRDVQALSRTSSDLLSQNEALERRVRERTGELEEARAYAERERHRVEALLRDSSHRIGNSLATVSSLLGLQVLRARSDEVRAALDSARSRVHAIASGHRRLRLGDDLETVRADEFLGAVVDDLRQMQSTKTRVEVSTSFMPVTLRARDATTIAIILGELITNATKHAFGPERPGQLWIDLLEDNGEPALIVEDDGYGMASPGEGEQEGLGSVIVRQLAQPFGGRPEYSERPGGGTRVVVLLPGLEVLTSDPAA